MTPPRSDGDTATPASDLTQRVTALTDAVELARGVFPDAEVDAAAAIVAKAAERLRHGTHHTVVAIAGATGSGKSSIVNRLAGAELSDSGVRRPTTSVTHAAVWGDADAGPLLDWLEVQRRHRVDDGSVALDGLVLLDLPDHDSTAVEHRLEVDRLVALVDVLVWVTDPQKYADEALHAGYIAPLAGHATILRFVLNQVDRLPDGGVEVAADLRRLIEADGVPGPTVLAVSATTGAGFEQLEKTLHDAVADRRASVDRLEADVAEAATSLRRGEGTAETRGRIRATLIEGLGEAAGSGPAADIAAAHHRRQGSLTMGWPFTRFLRRLGRRPLADLPGPGRSAASAPRADLALRDYAEAVATELDAPWPATVRTAAMGERDPLLDELRSSVGSAAIRAGQAPRWWTLFAWLQRLLAVTAIVGLVWLLVVAVLGGFFQFDTEPLLPPTPEAEWMPLPSAMLIGGVLLGLVLGVVCQFPLGVGARRRAREARKSIEASIETVADARVVEPVEAALADQRSLEELLVTAMG
jgi:GTP-binding protein EngB required for normal cell division